MSVTAAGALAWRLQRHGLDPVAGTTATAVVERVVAVRAWPEGAADLAVALRGAGPGALARALDGGSLVRSYAFRGGSYAMAPSDAAALLAVRTTTRVWETARYQAQGGFALPDWEALRTAVAEVLAAGPRTREEIAAHLAEQPALAHLAPAATGTGSDSLYKPLHWWGDICFGPSRDGRTTFRRLADDAQWPGALDPDVAGPRAITSYLVAYAPATTENLAYWLTDGLGAPRRRVLGWLEELGESVVRVDVDGRHAYALAADLDPLASAVPRGTVRLLPPFDPWVLGPGTADPLVVAPERRALVSRGSALVVADGVVAGVWRVRGDEVQVTWFDEAGPVPTGALRSEVEHLGVASGRGLRLAPG